MIPTRGKIMCEIVSREKVLPSGIIIPDKLKSEKKDNVCKCLGVGDGVETIRRTDLIHYKQNFGQKISWQGKKLIFLKENEIIAIERGEEILAIGSNVICKLIYKEKMGTIFVPETVKQNSGDYHGEVVSTGPEFPDKLTKGDKIVYMRNEGYRFRTFETREDMISLQEKWIGGKHED